MSFAQKKQHILSQISSTDESNPDASPKGTIDEAVVPLIDLINSSEDFVTTSSCSGRVSVFLEGIKNPQKIGGKGLGGKWLYVTHDDNNLRQSLSKWWEDGVKGYNDDLEDDPIRRYVIYKFEPMILHVKCRTHDAACRLFSTAMGCGFRESGIGSNDIVAIRISMRQDLPIGYISGKKVVPLVSDEYIRVIDEISLDLFDKNQWKINELSKAIETMFNTPAASELAVETKEQRRERKRAEGLRRQQELKNS